jgi:Fur family ferric uptake transcriptional regulator
MAFEKERSVFEDYIRNKNLRHSEQRLLVLYTFLKSEKHLTADELYKMVKRKNPSIGTATVYRTLKLLRDCGLCRELRLDDGLVEAVDPEIEKLQERLARVHGFTIKRHKLEIYGICRRCRN